MFDWRDNLNLADALRAGATGAQIVLQGSEATTRCAVGRAYYAAFGHARAYAMLRLGFVSTGTGSDHGRLIAHFRTLGQRRIAARLQALRGWRNQCDYDDSVPTLHIILQDSLRDAAAVINQL